MPIILTSTYNKKIDCDHNVFIHIGNWLKMGWISNFLTIRKQLVWNQSGPKSEKFEKYEIFCSLHFDHWSLIIEALLHDYLMVKPMNGITKPIVRFKVYTI
jgi:hypothetical protein